jgi:hypothetical protein
MTLDVVRKRFVTIIDRARRPAYDARVTQTDTSTVHLAFRFHVNFVHSYRGDTPDERGFGKDIRIIRGIVRALDEANARGVPVRGTWDIENHYSLATVMPRHCPDLLGAIRRRVRENGDVADHLSLRAWLKRLRRHQRSMREPCDLLLLIDSDADDEFWAGYNWPVVSDLLAAAGGLAKLIRSVAGLPFLSYTTPGGYLRDHEPVATIAIRQDTADGSFDGYASWAEKWTNQALWTGIERSRLAELHVLRLLEDAPATDDAASNARAMLARAFEARLLALSTTYFGLASPLVNVARLAAGAGLVASAVDDASEALALARNAWVAATPRADGPDGIAFDVLDFQRGVPTDAVACPLWPSRSLVAVPLAIDARLAIELSRGCRLRRADGATLPCAVRGSSGGSLERSSPYELLFMEENGGGERHEYTLIPGAAAPERAEGGRTSASILASPDVAILFDARGNAISIRGPGCELSADPLLATSVTWAGRTYTASMWHTTEEGASPCGSFLWRRTRADIALPAGRIGIEREYLLGAGLPYAFVCTRMRYPATPPAGCPSGLATRFGRTWDGRWQEAMPCEIRPLLGDGRTAFRVWKRNWLDSVTSYDLDYGSFSRNRELDSSNNHLTAGWVAFSDRRRGLLVGQESARWSSPAFCPIRTRRASGGLSLTLNPFGTYRGRQLSYPTRATGLGRRTALLMADQLAPLTPDYAGRSQDFTLLLAPYLGDRPPVEATRDAEAFAYPCLVVPRSPLVATQPWDRWHLEPHDQRYNLVD